MGSSHFGEPGLGNGRSGSSSSRKGKKSMTNSDKPKQPQRGLGVAQLERIRLNNQMNMNCAYLTPPVQAHHPFHPNLNQEGGVMRTETGYAPVPVQAAPDFAYPSQTPSPSPHQFSFHPMMGMGDMASADNRLGGNSHQSSAAARWSHGILENQYATQRPSGTIQLFGMHMEEPAKKRGHDWFDAMGSSSQKSSSSENDEIDLDLKL